jgi:hypothetical protein
MSQNFVLNQFGWFDKGIFRQGVTCSLREFIAVGELNVLKVRGIHSINAFLFSHCQKPIVLHEASSASTVHWLAPRRPIRQPLAKANSFACKVRLPAR